MVFHMLGHRSKRLVFCDYFSPFSLINQSPLNGVGVELLALLVLSLPFAIYVYG